MKNISNEDVNQQLIALTTQFLAESGEPYKREVRLEDSLQHRLGIDSLGRAELFRRIEKAYGVILPDSLLAQAETLNDLAAYLYTAEASHMAKQNKIVTLSHEHVQVDPHQAQSLIDILLMYGEKAPQKPHIYFQTEDGHEQIITYGELLTKSLQVAKGLRAFGLQDNETVAIMQPTSPDFFYSFFGTLLAGGVPVPIYPPFRMHMLEAYAKTEARILSNAEVRVLITFGQAEKLSRLLQSFVPSLKKVTTVEELSRANQTLNIFHARTDNHAFIQYTSGSTSDPKGVLLTHHNLLSNIRAYGKAIKASPEDVAVSWLPLYHDMGLIGMWLGSLYFGIPLVLLTPFSFLNHPERWLWAIHNYRGTVSGAPNFAYELCIRKIEPSMIEGLDLSSWRIAANGAEKIYPNTLEQFNKKFAPYGLKNTTLLPVYGLAESTVGLAIPPLEREFRLDKVDRVQFEEHRQAVPTTGDDSLTYVACGMAIEGQEIRIVDETGQVLPERHIGQLQFRGPSTMQGYYNNVNATRAIYHDGWIDSGDLAYLADSEVFITGRLKDLIIKAGRNLYPSEIEEIIGVVPGIRQGCVAVFGSSDPTRATEQLVVVAETREKDKTKRAEIIQAIKEAMTDALDIVPDAVVLVKPHTVPKTSSGKLQRGACKKMYQAGKLGRWRLPPWLQVSKLAAESFWEKVKKVVQTIGKSIYTLYMFLLITLTLIPTYLLIVLSSPETARKMMRQWANLILKLSFCPIHIQGKENLMPSTAVIYAANHASYADALVALALVPHHTLFVGKKELFTTPILRTFMRKLNYLSVDRLDFSKGVEDTQRIESVLKTGYSIFIFPEGTFSYSSGLRPFRLGAFKMAAEAKIPVCPIALQGMRRILRGEEKLLCPGAVSIRICKPVSAIGEEWQDVTQLRNQVRAEIAEYCGEPSLDYIAASPVAPRHTQ